MSDQQDTKEEAETSQDKLAIITAYCSLLCLIALLG